VKQHAYSHKTRINSVAPRALRSASCFFRAPVANIFARVCCARASPRLNIALYRRSYHLAPHVSAHTARIAYAQHQRAHSAARGAAQTSMRGVSNSEQ